MTEESQVIATISFKALTGFARNGSDAGETNNRGSTRGYVPDVLALEYAPKLTCRASAPNCERKGAPDIRLGFIGYILILSALVLGEGAFNMVAFEVFGEAKPFTLVRLWSLAL